MPARLTEDRHGVYSLGMESKGGRDPRIAPIVERLRRENAAAERRAAERREAALAEAERLARAFGHADSGVLRVTLFGSLLPGRDFGERSDIDLAVEGGDLAMLARLADASPFDVDLLPLEALREGVKDAVLLEGVVLYEKKS